MGPVGTPPTVLCSRCQCCHPHQQGCGMAEVQGSGQETTLACKLPRAACLRPPPSPSRSKSRPRRLALAGQGRAKPVAGGLGYLRPHLSRPRSPSLKSHQSAQSTFKHVCRKRQGWASLLPPCARKPHGQVLATVQLPQGPGLPSSPAIRPSSPNFLLGAEAPSLLLPCQALLKHPGGPSCQGVVLLHGPEPKCLATRPCSPC